MRGSGFPASVAAGIEAAASSGGALVPPVMGAGAYMMLEIIDRDPPVRFLEIVKAAIIPAVLYYLSLFLLVHFYAAGSSSAGRRATEAADRRGRGQRGRRRHCGGRPVRSGRGRHRRPAGRVQPGGAGLRGGPGHADDAACAGYSPFRAVSLAWRSWWA